MSSFESSSFADRIFSQNRRIIVKMD